MQIDTTNILFICGGAFDGLEKIIENRIGKKAMGFGADVKSRADTPIGELLRQVLPTDLLKFGLIPEFVGRIPVIATLDRLDEDALVRVLTEPKNALVKQYTKLLDYDGVDLEFRMEALRAIAKEAITRNTGARGLRAIMEKIMLAVMYDAPSRTDIKKCIITEEVILQNELPILLTESTKPRKKKDVTA